MCYVIYLSTTTDEDLGAIESERLRFEPIAESDDPAILALLDYPYKWYLTREFYGCSCHFRHDNSHSGITGERLVEFGPPEDWCPEDADDIEASMAAREEFNRIVEAGHQLDVIDIWSGTPAEDVIQLNVCLGDVPAASFRFFLDYRLVMTA